MMFGLRKTNQTSSDVTLDSRLLDQNSFYGTFLNDLKKADYEVIIESPFIAARRIKSLLPTLTALSNQGVRLVINTKPPEEQEPEYYEQTLYYLAMLQQIDNVKVLLTGGHHRKLAIIDRQILYEGSLNILSQNDSCEVMRRIYSDQLACQMIDFICIGRFIG